MQKLKIYTSSICGYCIAAKELLKELDISFEEINIDGEPSLRKKMIKESNGRTTVPQIFLGNKLLGGCDDLFAMHQNGDLTKFMKPYD